MSDVTFLFVEQPILVADLYFATAFINRLPHDKNSHDPNIQKRYNLLNDSLTIFRQFQ